MAESTWFSMSAQHWGIVLSCLLFSFLFLFFLPYLHNLLMIILTVVIILKYSDCFYQLCCSRFVYYFGLIHKKIASVEVVFLPGPVMTCVITATLKMRAENLNVSPSFKRRCWWWWCLVNRLHADSMFVSAKSKRSSPQSALFLHNAPLKVFYCDNLNSPGCVFSHNPWSCLHMQKEDCHQCK